MRIENFVILLCFLLIFLGLYLNIKRDREPIKALDVKTAKELIHKRFFDYIIDVRSQREYNESRFPSAINIPLNEIYNEMKLYDMRSKVLLYEGARASMGKKILNEMGFKNVYYLKTNFRRLI